MTSLYLLNQTWAKNTLSRRAVAVSFLKKKFKGMAIDLPCDYMLIAR
jgi:hypothetical protein